jgi:hypothetical protein
LRRNAWLDKIFRIEALITDTVPSLMLSLVQTQSLRCASLEKKPKLLYNIFMFLIGGSDEEIVRDVGMFGEVFELVGVAILLSELLAGSSCHVHQCL